MRVVTFSPRARRQIRAAANWWEEHRDKAPEAFDQDLSSAVESLATTPFLAATPVRSRKPGIRRMLLERIRYYLYYRVFSNDEVEIVAIWHASRRPPRLDCNQPPRRRDDACSAAGTAAFHDFRHIVRVRELAGVRPTHPHNVHVG